MIENLVAIKVENLQKKYKLYNKPIDRLKEALNPFGRKYHHDFYALKNINFNINKGETVGIIGKNGSGKSTLLKLITGVLTPSEGKLTINGNVAALLELGAGFNPEYTGIENIYLNGTIMGFSKEEMDSKLEQILSFADIGEFVNQPVKIYSSGMFVRLAFALAINVEPDILIIDEALSVGDIKFQQKCYRKIEEFRENKTILFVTHDMGAINKFCERVIWLNEGEIIEDGDPYEISKKYQAFMIDSKLSKYAVSDNQYNDSENDVETFDLMDTTLDVFGDKKAEIIGVGLFDLRTNRKCQIVTPGQKIKLLIKVRYNQELYNPIVGFTCKDRLGNIVTQSNSYVLYKNVDAKVGQTFCYCFQFTMPSLNDGEYTISPAVASGTQEEHTQHCWVHDALVFQVINKKQYLLQGFLYLDDIEFYELG